MHCIAVYASMSQLSRAILLGHTCIVYAWAGRGWAGPQEILSVLSNHSRNEFLFCFFAGRSPLRDPKSQAKLPAISQTTLQPLPMGVVRDHSLIAETIAVLLGSRFSKLVNKMALVKQIIRIIIIIRSITIGTTCVPIFSQKCIPRLSGDRAEGNVPFPLPPLLFPAVHSHLAADKVAAWGSRW